MAQANLALDSVAHSLAAVRNFSLHLGHSIASKSTRLTRSGVIVSPHFGHVLSSEARTFSMSIFRDRGISSLKQSAT
jgi:hypothetical protein